MIVDTSFLVDLMRGDRPARLLLEELEGGSAALKVPTPALYELWEANERSRYPVRELEALDELLAGYPQLALTPGAAKRAGRLSGQLIRRGLSLDDVDVLIAAIALEAGEAVVTRKADAFGRVEGLRVQGY